MKNKTLLFTFSVISLLSLIPAQADIGYTLDATFDVSTGSLSALVNISISSGDVADTDSMVFSTSLAEAAGFDVISVAVNGDAVSVTPVDGRFTIEKPATSIVTVVIDYTITGVADEEGIFIFPDVNDSGRWSSWYPRLISSAADVADYSVTFSIDGPGALAHSAESQDQQKIGSAAIWSLKLTDSPGFELAYSPIFVEKRVQVDGCDLGLFVREGSDLWLNRLVTSLSEVYGFYAGKIPGFSRPRMDVVLAGSNRSDNKGASSLVLIHDDIEERAAEFGSVFVSNYIRWKASESLSRSFWLSAIPPAGEAIPWLQEGLALYYAERYARSALLGGPVFDNIKQFYLNAAARTVNTSLDMTWKEAEAQGIDPYSILARSKGLWVVGLLAETMGHQGFERFLDALADHDGPVTNHEIQQLAESASGISLDSWFRDWVFGNAYIDYGIRKGGNGSGNARVLLDNKGTASLPVEVQAVFEDGSIENKTVSLRSEEQWVEFNSNERLLRVRVDPDMKLPDINRADNLRSFGGSERIELLYAIDQSYDIGDIELVEPPRRSENGRIAKFQVTLTNKTEDNTALGIRLTASFPGGRNRGVSMYYVELSAGETRTIRDDILFPSKGIGLAEVVAEYFPVRNREQYSRIRKNSDPALVNYYIFDIIR